MQPILKTVSLSLVLSVATLSPAWAQKVLRVSSAAAQEGNVPITVHIEGGGVLLDFAPTDERITKISIDDPSRIVVDHCLVTKSCNEIPSPVIRLFRSSGISFQDIPAAKTTMLSVETIDTQGNYHSYPFPITIGTGRSLVSKILIEDEASDSLFTTGIATRNRSAATTIALGVEEAEAKSLLVDPQLKARIRNYLALIESGMSSKKAANRAGISADLVTRLAHLGQDKVREAEAKQERVALRPSSLPLAANPRVTVLPKKTTQNVHQPKLAIAKPTSSTALLPAEANPTPPTSVRPKNKTQNVRESRSAIAKPTPSIAPLPKSAIAKPTPSIKPLPKSSVTGTSTLTYNPAKNHLQANALVRGLIIAKRRNSINKTTAAKVQDAIATLRSGKDINTAAKRAGVSIDKINELLSLAGD